MFRFLLEDLRVFGLLLVISLVLIFADQSAVLNFPKTAIQIVTSPIQYGLYKSAQGFAKQFEFIFLARKAVNENKAMSEQMAQILSENATLRKQLAEAQGQLAQQNVLSQQTFNLLGARPVGMGRYLVIDRGSNDGVKVDQVVLYKNYYIGNVKNVNPKKSEVLLSSDPDSHIAAFSQSTTGKARGVLTGNFGSEMLLDKILHEEEVQVGDLVYSEGTEQILPRGLVLGQVAQVLGRDNEIFKQAKVKPVFDITNLDIVFVVLN